MIRLGSIQTRVKQFGGSFPAVTGSMCPARHPLLRRKPAVAVVRVVVATEGASPKFQRLTKIVRLAAGKLGMRERPNISRFHEHDIVGVLHFTFDDKERFLRNQEPHAFE